MWTDYGMHMGWMGLWWVVGLGVLAAAIWAMARAGGTAPGPGPGEPPEAILKRRYASGQIGRDEYERGLTDLRR